MSPFPDQSTLGDRDRFFARVSDWLMVREWRERIAMIFGARCCRRRRRARHNARVGRAVRCEPRLGVEDRRRSASERPLRAGAATPCRCRCRWDAELVRQLVEAQPNIVLVGVAAEGRRAGGGASTVPLWRIFGELGLRLKKSLHAIEHDTEDNLRKREAHLGAIGSIPPEDLI